MHICRVCGQSKPADEMSVARGRVTTRCKTCSREYLAEWARKNPDRVAEHNRRKAQPEQVERKRAYMRQRYHSMDVDARRDNDYRRMYGISLAEYEEIKRQQDGVCAICGEPPCENSGRVPGVLVVDHCHTNGHVRGLLCFTCNLAIGYFKDNPDHLLSAAQYLLKDVNLLKKQA